MKTHSGPNSNRAKYYEWARERRLDPNYVHIDLEKTRDTCREIKEDLFGLEGSWRKLRLIFNPKFCKPNFTKDEADFVDLSLKLENSSNKLLSLELIIGQLKKRIENLENRIKDSGFREELLITCLNKSKEELARLSRDYSTELLKYLNMKDNWFGLITRFEYSDSTGNEYSNDSDSDSDYDSDSPSENQASNSTNMGQSQDVGDFTLNCPLELEEAILPIIIFNL